jgi:transposase
METGVDPARQARRRQTYSDPERPAAVLGIATGGAFVMATMFGMFPFLMKLYADSGYQGPLFRRNVEIVKRSDYAKGFVVLPKRWVVERTFAWLGRCRRLARDLKATIASAVAWALVAHIRILTRRIARA